MQAVLGLHRGKLYSALWQLNELLNFSYTTSCGTVSKLSDLDDSGQRPLTTSNMRLVFIIFRTSYGLPTTCITGRYRYWRKHCVLSKAGVARLSQSGRIPRRRGDIFHRGFKTAEIFPTHYYYLVHKDLRSTFSGIFEVNVNKSTVRSHVFGRVRLILTYFNAFSPSILKLDKTSAL